MKNFYEVYGQIINDPKLSKSEKISLLQKAQSDYAKEAETEGKNAVRKYRTGAAIEMLSSAVPLGGAGKLGAQAGLNLLKNKLGNKISQEVGASIASSIPSGAVFGLGRGMLEDKNPLVTSAQDTVTGATLGGALGIGGAQLQKMARDNVLRNAKPKGMSYEQYGKFKDMGKNYYKDYLQQRDVNNEKLGRISIRGKGLSETYNKNAWKATAFPDTINDLKKSDNIHTNYLYKPRNDDFQKFHVITEKNNDYFVGELPKNEKRLYFVKESKGDNGLPRLNAKYKGEVPIREFKPPFTQSEIGSMTNEEFMHYEPIIMKEFSNGNIITDKQSLWHNTNNINPDENIFTREQIRNMTPDEYSQNESKIMKQLKEKGIPTNQELNETRAKQLSKSSNTKNAANGHWVTKNGKHIYVE